MSERSSPTASVVIAGRGLERAYRTRTGSVTAFRGIDIEVVPGRLLVVAGPSGVGKSSLLRILALLEPPDSGTLIVDGFAATTWPARRRRRWRARHLVHLFQRPTDNLVADLDAGQNVLLSAGLRGAPPPDVASALDQFGLGARADHRLAQLSGGEQQRLAFASALASRPSVITADEPTAELDRASAGPVIASLRRLTEHGAAVVVASHDSDVLQVADEVLRLEPVGAR